MAAVSAGPRSGRPGAAVCLLVAVTGYSLTFWAWSLAGPFGPAPQLWPGLGGGGPLLAVLAAVIVGSLGRIPVGVWTDRYGAGIVLPVISVLAAAAVLLLTVAGPGLGTMAAAPLGVGGTSFAAGAAVVIRAFPPGRRGVWLSVFGAGMGLASAAAIVSRLWIVVDRRSGLPLLALALIGHAIVAAVLLHERSRPARYRARGRDIVLTLLRLPATRYLCAWYAVGFGGLVAAGLYLPAYLHRCHQLPAGNATLVTGACLTLAAACRPLGGWLCRRHNPVRVLRNGFTGAGLAVLALALQPDLAVATGALGVLAACLGSASGAVQALIGDTAHLRHAGLLAGTVGAIGGLAGVLPPLLLAGTYGISGTYGVGLTLLAAVVMSTAWHLHRHRQVITATLAFPDTEAFPDDPAPPVVAVTSPSHRSPGEQADGIATLARLATERELVIVAETTAGGSGHPIIAGLRMRLPRHRIVGLTSDGCPHSHEISLITELVHDGVLPVIETRGAAGAEIVAASLTVALGTTDILRPGSPPLNDSSRQPLDASQPGRHP